MNRTSDFTIFVKFTILSHMSKLNIIGIVRGIRSKTNIYTPIIEAIVNAIDSIYESGRKDGEIVIYIKRDLTLNFDEGTLPPVKSIEIVDNGIGFNQKNRDSFDTFYSDMKIARGGKGFGRFMFLKYFNEATVNSTYSNGDTFHRRTFRFGKQYDIVTNETDESVDATDTETHIYLNDVIENKYLDKGLETIARKLLERLLIFFVDDEHPCPTIKIVDTSDKNKNIILNHYITQDNDIKLIDSKDYEILNSVTQKEEKFTAKIFKVLYAQNQKSKICLTGHSREVTEVTLHSYIPEFEDDFFDEEQRGKEIVRKNYIIKVYVVGKYLNDNVSLEREAFNFDKEKKDEMYPISQMDIEIGAAEKVKELFSDEVKVREDKKKTKITEYINSTAPWHRSYMSDLPLDKIPYHATEEQIELAFQKVKYKKEQEARIELKGIIDADDKGFESDLAGLASKVTEAGKNDLAHYVCNRRIVLKLLEQLRKRKDDGRAELEKELHNLIFPMGGDSQKTSYEEHNLWLLDERLVFSEYIASDKKISAKNAPKEPDLVIFDKKRSYRNGDNEFSNPLTVFEFKRPKRTTYSADEDPIEQIGNYVNEIRSGKYETPEGVEAVKVNECTPVYGYIICDPCDRINYFAHQRHQLTQSPDKEGFFGYHSGYKIYFEIISYKRLANNAELRNKIFFNKLNIQ